MVKLKEKGICRIFFSSPFRGMEGEREDLTRRYWPQIQALCNAKGLQFVPVDMRWGITTEMSNNNQTVNVCLREIDRSDVFVGFFGQRYGWHGESDVALQQSYDAAIQNYSWIDQHRDKSVTELEFLHGHLNHPGKIPTVICFRDKAWDEVQRNIGEEKGDKRAIAMYSSESDHATELMDDLKQRTKATENKTLGVHLAYKDPHEGAKLMSEAVLQYLEDHLLKDIVPSTNTQSSRALELAQHDAYCDTRMSFYVANEEHRNILNGHVSQPKSGILHISGDSGVGKTALLCSWIRQLQNQNTDTLLVYHFVGSSRNSINDQHSIVRIVKELAFLFRTRKGIPSMGLSKLEEEIESAYILKDERDVAAHFKKLLSQVSEASEKAVIIIDGLDKMIASRNARPFYWLPSEIPEGIHLIMSTKSDYNPHNVQITLVDSLKEKWNITELLIESLTSEQQTELCQSMLKLRGKELSPGQMKVVCDAENTRNPLFLKIVIEELCMFGKFRELDKKIESLVTCQSSEELFGRYLERMEQDYNSDDYQGNLVKQVMCALLISRNGISESHLMEMLDISSHLWSPLYYGMQNYIILRKTTISLGYSELKNAVYTRYIVSDDNLKEHYNIQKEFYLKKYKTEMEEPGVEQRDTKKFRMVEEALYCAHKCSDVKTVFSLICRPSILKALASQDTRSNLLLYVQNFNFSQDTFVDLMFEAFDRFMAIMYSQHIEEDLIVHPNVVYVLMDGLNALHAFLKFANFLVADERVLLRKRRVLENLPKDDKMIIDLWTTNYQLGQLHLEEKETTKALTYFTYCAENLDNLVFEEKDSYLNAASQIFHALGTVHQVEGNVKPAREYFTKSIESHSQRLLETNDGDAAIAKSQSCLAWCCYLEGEYEEALKLYQELSQLEESVYFGELPLEVAHTLTNMGIVLRRLGKLEEAERAYNKAMSIKQNICGMYHMDTAIAYVNVSNLHLQMMNFDKAEENLKKAWIVLQKLEMENGVLAWTVLENLMNSLQPQSKYEECCEYYPKIYKYVVDNNMFDKSLMIIHYHMAQYLAFDKDQPQLGYEILGHLIRSKHVNGDVYYFANVIARTKLFVGQNPLPVDEDLSLKACMERFPDYVPAWEETIQYDILPDKEATKVIEKLEEFYHVNGGTYTEPTLVVITCQKCVDMEWLEGACDIYQHFRVKFNPNEVILRNLAMVALRLEKNELSLECFEELVNQQPDSWMFNENVFFIKLKLNDIAGAMETLNVMGEKFRDQPELSEKVAAFKEDMRKHGYSK